MRCYLYLTNSDQTIRDYHGMEVSDRESARRLAIQVIGDIGAAHPDCAAQGAGLEAGGCRHRRSHLVHPSA